MTTQTFEIDGPLFEHDDPEPPMGVPQLGKPSIIGGTGLDAQKWEIPIKPQTTTTMTVSLTDSTKAGAGHIRASAEAEFNTDSVSLAAGPITIDTSTATGSTDTYQVKSQEGGGTVLATGDLSQTHDLSNIDSVNVSDLHIRFERGVPPKSAVRYQPYENVDGVCIGQGWGLGG